MDANVKPTIAREVGGCTANRPVIQCFDLILASKQLYNFDAVASPGFAHRFGPLVFSSNSQSQKDLEVFFAALDLASHSHQTSKWNGAATTITIGRTMLLVLFRLSALMMIPYLIVPGHPYRISFYSRAWYTSLYGNSR